MRKSWKVSRQPDLYLYGRVLIPALAAWRTERLESPEPKNEYLGFVPDWVCEIQSERTDERLSIYSEYDISYVWLVDRRTQTFEVLRREGASWISLKRYRRGAEKTGIVPFDAENVDLRDVWRARS